MPSDDYCTVELLVGNSTIPEYSKNGMVYVESNLHTPVSYQQSVCETLNGEEEKQVMPVTPYMIRVTANNAQPQDAMPHYFRIMVDGVKVKGVSLAPGQHKIVKGFRDAAVVRELLFSLPRTSKNTDGTIDNSRLVQVGKVEVECWQARLLDHTYEIRHKQLDFQQASKHDSLTVTQGMYTMATSKAGKAVCKRRMYRSVDQWKRIKLLSKQTVHYHMGHTLESMGFTIRPYPVFSLTKKKQSDYKRPSQVLELESSTNEENNSSGNSSQSRNTKSEKVKNDNKSEVPSLTIKEEGQGEWNSQTEINNSDIQLIGCTKNELKEEILIDLT